MNSVKDVYKEWAEKYDEEDKFNIATQADRDILIPLLQPKKTDLILDVGCGTGRFTIPLAKKCKKIIGVDISSQMLNVAKYKSGEIRNIEFIKLNNSKRLPFRDSTFDKVICALVTNHIKDLRPFLKELNRVMKKGGVLVYDDFALDITKPFVGSIKSVLKKFKDEGKIQYHFHSINRNIHSIHRLDMKLDKLIFTRVDEKIKHTMTPGTYKRNRGHTYGAVYRVIKQ